MANVVKGFGFTGALQSFVVPAQVTQLIIECWGAGGLGGYTKGTIVVTPGQVFYVFVGGDNGWNGGGSGGKAGNATGNNWPYGGGNGAGATDIRSGGTALTNRIMVAGGCGGSPGWNGPYNADSIAIPTSPYPYGPNPFFSFYSSVGFGWGGVCFGANGEDGAEAMGASSDSTGVSGTQGKGATQSAGGAASAGTGTGATGGTAGASGQGGNGGNGTTTGAGGAGGGGGGGGYYGGSGGGGGGLFPTDQDGNGETSGGGGGGGSSWINTSDFTATSIVGPVSLYPGVAYSNGDGYCQISYVQPPTVPTPSITTPNNTGTAGEFDVTQPIEFAWQFASLAPGESQSRFDIQYSSNGGTSWTEISEPNNTSQTYTFPANFFTAATTYDVQVRVYDQEGVPSAWSASVVFEAISLPGAPTITAPVAGSNIETETFTVTWTIPSGTQSDYWVQIYDASGKVLIDTGTVASATESYSATLTYSEAENVTIAVRYQTTTSGGVWSTIATETAFLNLDPPATPVVNIGTDDDGGTISLAITNPAGAYATVYNDIYRTDLTNNTPEIRIATNVPPNSTYTDYTPASGIYYSYRVRAYSASGGVADDAGVGFTGIDNTLTTFAGGATLSNGVYTIPENGSVTFWARINGSAQWTWRAQYYTSTESPSPSFQPNGGSLQNAQYFADDRTTAEDNSASYTGNGNAQAVPLNSWTTIEWSYLGGPNVQWLKMTVSADTGYVGGTLKIQNPVILNT